jgi:hypothetical protein
MSDMRSVAQMLRLRAEQGATRDELEVELRSDGLSDVEQTVLTAYVWALIRVAARSPEAGGDPDDARP